MASRDLTSQYFKYRDQAKRRRNASGNDGSNHGSNRRTPTSRLTAGGRSGDNENTHSLMLMEEGENDGIQMTTFHDQQRSQPAWVSDVDDIKSILQSIKTAMADLHSLHASRIGSVFGKDLDGMETRIENMTRDITDQFRKAERILKKVGNATRQAGGEDVAIGTNLQRNLARQLQELSVSFRQSQRKYLADVKAQKSGGFDGVTGTSNDRFAGVGDLSSDGGSFFTTQQVQVVDDLQASIESRDQEIVKIAQSIEELGTIFKELAVLVIDQGTILDRIDYNMETVVESTQTGVKQLERAERAQQNARPMKCIVCLVITIFILMVILFLKHKKW